MYANCKDIQNRSKRIASNTLVLFARMLIITFVNLYTVRWVLAGLGTEDYGIFNAVAGVVTAVYLPYPPNAFILSQWVKENQTD